tara:strand:+ start:2690 stop:3136 length:447 start_codon:yes stop_codon:yes gene_type:complete
MPDIFQGVLNSIKDRLSDETGVLGGNGVNVYGCDLHNELFNTYYFIIGRYEAKNFLGEYVFEAMEVIKEYEQDNFGEVTTDLSEPEKVVNMLAYIIGEQILCESDYLQEKWDNKLTEEDIKIILSDVEVISSTKKYCIHTKQLYQQAA